jgi:hypothetical protein
MNDTKLQAPSSKLQRNFKFQTPTQRLTGRRVIGVWNLVLLWILDLGTWIFLLTLSIPSPLNAAPKKDSPIITIFPAGRLLIEADAQGNRIPDFSHCGYAGGDKPIPDAPVRVVVAPASGDSTARIQKAIDYVASLPPDSNGLRGAVLLLKGRHECNAGLLMKTSGVVLRGQGMEEAGTVLLAAGLDRRTLIRIAGKPNYSSLHNTSWVIADDYIPVGAMTFRLKDTTGLKVGDTITVTRPSTKEWIAQLGMNEFGGGIGSPVWAPGSRDLAWDRIIRSIDGERISIDAPITTAIQSEFGGGRVEKYSYPGRINNVGIENLRCVSAFDPKNPKDENHSWMCITLEAAEDAWVRQVTAEHFAGSLAAVWESCKQVTVQDCASLQPVSEEGGYRRNTFFTMAQMTLFLRCFAEHGWHDFAVGHCAAGPNAFVQCESRQPLRDSGPIESWASGVLYDNVRIDGQGLTLANRGHQYQGSGWAAANSVLWQCSASVITCANPPTARNWAFGCWGEFEGNGIWRSSNQSVKPDSLYAAQLADRLDRPAAAHLQLMPRSTAEYSNPTVEQAARQIAASHKPAAQLSDYIATAATRDPIPAEPVLALRVEELPAPAGSAPHPPSQTASAVFHPFVITNGWLTCDGRLLTGDRLGVMWWRGTIRPADAPTSEVDVTRFVPGRIGRGFTDDLEGLADEMAENGAAALDHHYGLWYERRRDDHERVRRIDGDVWPPFYEMPFARTGQGTAWNGLSLYDLTKYNPWYWDRLKQFATACDSRGLVLFHENYFQHNILEAGAHWADSPWRPANNLNNTGFPEPPPYAGDKRIFMAEQFYDLTHPVRRALHRAYIRQCLENFATNSNVIQFTSAEYTGPLSFVEFWLDTIAEWSHETGHKPLVALSCTKDVQDAILADGKRSPQIDLIDFQYWWRTSKGLFAPKGGQNLAPRQFERQWKGGRPADIDLAQMAAEYRHLYRDKAIICDFGSAGWAYLCAGGSLPRLPKDTDKRLLAAVPQMQPWRDGAEVGRWALREPGRQYLICLAHQAATELDLSEEKGTFAVSTINLQTGAVTALPLKIQAGAKANLPGSGGSRLLWLTREY